jgi:hypothetical protein
MKKFLLDYITCHICSSTHQTVDQNAPEKNAVSLNRENILLETFHRSNVAAYQAKDEISSTYNIYLLVAGIMAAGLPVVQELIYRPETNQEFKYFLVGLSGTVLVFSGLLSVGFLG